MDQARGVHRRHHADGTVYIAYKSRSSFIGPMSVTDIVVAPRFSDKDLEAERSVLGSILLSEQALDETLTAFAGDRSLLPSSSVQCARHF